MEEDSTDTTTNNNNTDNNNNYNYNYNWTLLDPEQSSSPPDVYWLHNPCSSFEFFMCTVVIGTVCLIGIVGNILAFVVLGNDRRNRVVSFLLRSLAVADNFLLIVSAIVLSSVLGPFQIPGAIPALRQAIPYMKKYVNPFGPIAQSCTIWMTVLLAVNRYVAVCKPFASKRLLTLRKAQVQVAAVVVLSVVFNVPRFFLYDVAYRVDNNVTVPRKQLASLGKDVSFDIGYFHVFYNIVILVLPLVALVVFNTKIIWDMQRSKSKMQRNSLYYAGLQERNITIVMLIIILKLIVFHSPDRIVSAVKIIEVHRNPNLTCPHPVIYAAHFTNLLVILSSSTDFFIYCIFRERFRRLFCVRFCCRSRVSGSTQNNSFEYGLSNNSCESNYNNNNQHHHQQQHNHNHNHHNHDRSRRRSTITPIDCLFSGARRKNKNKRNSSKVRLLSRSNSLAGRQVSTVSQNGHSKPQQQQHQFNHIITDQRVTSPIVNDSTIL